MVKWDFEENDDDTCECGEVQDEDHLVWITESSNKLY
jgi:hypothetical protein